MNVFSLKGVSTLNDSVWVSVFPIPPFGSKVISYDVINEWIILGNEDCARDKCFLNNNNITHVLICAEGCEMFYESEYKYKCIYIDDAPDQNILQYFKNAFDFINDAIALKGKVYIHCV